MTNYDLHNYRMKAEVELSGEPIEAVIIFDYVGRIVYINQVVYKEKDIKSIISGTVEADLERRLYKTLGR